MLISDRIGINHQMQTYQRSLMRLGQIFYSLLANHNESNYRTFHMKQIKNIYHWFYPLPPAGDVPLNCSLHPSNSVEAVCCNDFCSDRYICKFPGCLEKHKNHVTLTRRRYDSQKKVVQTEINYRNKIGQMIRQYQTTFLQHFQYFLKQQTDKFLAEIDSRYFGRDLMSILQGTNYYSYLAAFREAEGKGMELEKYLKKEISLREKRIPNICKELISSEGLQIDESLIFRQPQLREITSFNKIDKIKERLPFDCELIPRYTASVHKFSVQALHRIRIRGPIILVAESHKKRTFGGFSMKMFPAEEKYVEDPRCQCLLFSLDDRVTMKLKQEYRKYSVRGGENLWFGRGDLAISNECHKANISWAEIGRAYEVPKMAQGRESEWLAGAKYFRILEYEIYQVELRGKKEPL